MPIITDALVANAAHDTSGNGGRKSVKLDNGWLVAAVYDATSGAIAVKFYVSKDNGGNFTLLTQANTTTVAWQGVSLASKGNRVYMIGSYNNERLMQYNFDATTVGPTINTAGAHIDTLQTAIGNNTLEFNEAKTELHASWSSKNAARPDSFNTRYAKGVIQSDGSVVWGTPQYANTVENSVGRDTSGQSIVVNGAGNPVILEVRKNETPLYYVRALVFNGASWNTYSVPGAYGVAYYHSNMSAIFVPKSINGLPNGRIWVAFSGADAAETNKNHLRVSYSDDGGVTWSSMVKVTNGTTEAIRPSITANKTNEIFIAVERYNATDLYSIDVYKNTNGSWGAPAKKVSGLSSALHPSTLYDPTFDFTEPLFIYKGASKVGFYGSWTITDISVPPGSIGEKTSKDSLLTYAITTDGAMSTITEKVNGVTVGTKTAASGQGLAVGLTQAQWDAVRHGKYHKTSNILGPYTSPSYETGSIGTIVGNPYTPATGAQTVRNINSIPVDGGVLLVSTAATHYIMVFEYNEAGNLLRLTSMRDVPKLHLLPGTKSFRYLAAKVDGNTVALTPAGISAIQLALTYVTYPKNTLTIEMGSNKWTYTFDKLLPAGPDLLSAVTAVKDANEAFYPAVKGELINTIRGKGGVVSDTAKWEDIRLAINDVEKWAIKKGGVIKSVQRGLASMGTAADYSLAISNVDLTKSFLKTYLQSPFDAAVYGLVGSFLSASNQITYRRGAGASGNLLIHWEVVEFSEGVKIQRGVTSLTATEAAKTVSITSVDLSKSTIYVSNYSASSASGSLKQMAIADFISSTSLSISRSANDGDISVYWTIVEYV